MKNSFLIISVFVGLVASILLIRGLVNSYNSLQQADESINAHWSNVVNQYQRRADLVPNLVRIVKAYAKHETGLFKDITQAHNSMSKGKTKFRKISVGTRSLEWLTI